jgi:chemotaxis protein MotB
MRLALLLVVLLSSFGCATSGQYRGLYKELTEVKRQLRVEVSERDARIEALQVRVASSEDRELQLAASEADLRSQLDTASTELDALQKSETAGSEQLRNLTQERERLAQKLEGVEADRSNLKSDSTRMRSQLADLRARQGEIDRQVKQYRDLLASFHDMIDSGQLKVKYERGRMVLELPSDVLFTSGSAELSEKGTIAIHQVAGVLKAVEQRTFQVEGHTDNVPIRTDAFPSNWSLAAARALVVVETMMTAGVRPDRLSAASFGEYRPAHSNRSTAGKTANRRIEIVLVPDLSNVPDMQRLDRAVGQLSREG